MEKNMIIALTGPESTGKTTMAKFLAHRYDGLYIKEMAREILEKNKGHYQLNEISEMAILQSNYEKKVIASAKKNQFVFVDTENINFKIWLEEESQVVPSWILEDIENSSYSCYFLMYPDIPWEADGIRTLEESRFYLFEKFQKCLDEYHKKYYIIKGIGQEREENLVQLMNKLYF